MLIVCEMLSKTDLQILSAVQMDASLTAQELGQSLNLSPSQAHRRRQRLETEGFIANVAARLDPERIGLSIQAFLFVSVKFAAERDAKTFAHFIGSLEQIVGAWNLTGESNCLLRAFCRDLAELQHLTQEVILRHKSVTQLHSHIVLDQTKQDSPLPIQLK